MTVRNPTLVILSLMTLIFSGCGKSEEELMQENCELIQQVKIVGAKDMYQTGDSIHLKMNVEPNIYLAEWMGGRMVNSVAKSEVLIDNCTKSDEGWYYLTVSYPECYTKIDSVYISIKNKVVTAPCSPPEYKVDFSGIPDIQLSYVTWSYNLSYGYKALHAEYTSGYPELNIYFNSYWNNKEPEDGEYSVSSLSSLSDSNPYTVYMSALYSSILFSAAPGKAYVSHVNGKIRVQFCDISFSGSNGQNTFRTTASTSITAP